MNQEYKGATKENKFSYSMVLLTYNQAATVQDAVESAIYQLGSPIEILISDDGSTDNTFDIVKRVISSYSGQHSIRLNRNISNLGLSKHLDLIHKISSGDVIIIAAGDDISYRNRVSKVIEVFESQDVQLVCSYVDVIDLQNSGTASGYKKATFYNTFTIEDAARSRALFVGATGAWKKSLYTKYGVIKEFAYEDLVMGFRACLEGEVVVLKERLVGYRIGDGITSKKSSIEDSDSFKHFQRKQICAADAVFAQRIEDARLFGIHNNSKVLKILKRRKKREEIKLTYYSQEKSDLLKVFFANPLLVIYTIYSERQKLHKFKKQRRRDGDAG